ncbi:ADAM 17 protease [Biomphalaria glabrata]|nr:ADAM 17 protease [Biomphalaria glabrata]
MSKRVILKTVKFRALGKNFVVHLEPGSPVIDHENVQIEAVYRNGSSRSVKIKKTAFYIGHVAGQRSSSVDALYLAGKWSMMIQEQEILFIEPLRKYDSNGRVRDMIIYRQTDVRTIRNNRSSDHNTSRSFCGVTNENMPQRKRFEDRETTWSRFQELSKTFSTSADDSLPPLYRTFVRSSERDNLEPRMPRSPVFYFNTCDMLAIMDTLAFKGVGGGSLYKSASILVYWYQLADSIFKKAQFGIFRGMRLKIKTIYIMTEFTPSVEPHFNRDPAIGQVHADEVKASLNKEKWFSHYCLAHLSTERKFVDNILGLASLANVPVYDEDDYRYSLPFWNEGICASNANNAAFSCIRMDDNVLSDAMYIVILTHEIAHGWGAQHDDNFHVSECFPSEEDGGKYIMWRGHNGAKDPNNLRFSPCSASSIQEVLLYKAHKCLLPAHAVVHTCGDSVVEFPEQCDEGLNPSSSCCTDNCRLKDGAVCSPFNHPCCTKMCGVAPKTQRCFQPRNLTCVAPSYCDAESFSQCPSPVPLPDGRDCEDRGTCWSGKCLSYCETKGRTSGPPVHLESCTCDMDRVAMCSLCCRAPGTNTCIPTPDHQDEGMPCLLGFCKNGKCEGTFEVNMNFVSMGGGQSLAMRNMVFIVIALTAPPFALVGVGLWLQDRIKKRKKAKDNAELSCVIISSKLSTSAGSKMVIGHEKIDQ